MTEIPEHPDLLRPAFTLISVSSAAQSSRRPALIVAWELNSTEKLLSPGVTVWPEDVDVAQEEVRSSPSWSEERCEELWDRVEGVRHKLTRILNPAKLTPYLRQCKVIDEQDEDEVLNSTQYPLRISKAGRLLDILRGQGQRGLQAFMESLEFYHPDQYTQLTGQPPTQRCSLILGKAGTDEEGPEGLTQFLLVEVRKLREQLRSSRVCERRLSQRCRVAEDERSRAERKAQELRQDRLQLERLRQDWESGSRELGKLKDRHLEQAVKYSRALEEQGKASTRESELLRQVEELRSRLTEADQQAVDPPGSTAPAKRNSSLLRGTNASPPALPEKQLRRTEVRRAENTGSQTRNSVPPTGVIALMDILQQDRREAAEQRQELCDVITRLQGDLQSTEEHWDKLESQCEQLQLKVRTLQLDWETEQKRSVSYFNQIMELEKERDQALRSRDSLQMEYTDCLLDKNRLRKRIAELQADLEQQQRELQRERERSRERLQHSSPSLHCVSPGGSLGLQRRLTTTRHFIPFPVFPQSHLSLCSEDQCYGPCCSLGLDLRPPANGTRPPLRKTPSSGHANDNSEDSRSNSEEYLFSSAEDNEKEINRLSTFPFPPCVDSINRRCNTETPSCSPSTSPPLSPKHRGAGLADDITIVGGTQTGIFVSHVRAGSPAELCGLKEGSELLELERVLFGGGSVQLAQCTAEVAHFSLQWWSEPSSLKFRSNPEAYSELCSHLSSPTCMGADSFYVRVNLNMEPRGDPPSLGVSCDDVIHVTDTRYNGKYHWYCSLVDPHTAKPLQAGTMPNYNRYASWTLIGLKTN
ncbi:Caspase recruitment domain-containing protein 10 [Liparis tanakae]|uniref:Caspase recruitment domain-containing protein 10 n=1 Tax=Liparis tanakae TaxID=230148 RepID=A0A4Z2GXT1_9TELE|nr:Caspase recruitment domain-containing protein 10 [Liparis tanakae]